MKYQYESVEGLRDLNPSDKAYGSIVRRVVSRLRKTIANRVRETQDTKIDYGRSGSDYLAGLGLAELFDESQANMVAFQVSGKKVVDDMNRLTDIMRKNPAPQNLTTPGMFSAWCKIIEENTHHEVNQLNADLDSLESSWRVITSFISRYIDLIPLFDRKGEGITSVVNSLHAMKTIFRVDSDFDLMIASMASLQTFSPRLRSLSLAMMRSAETFKNISLSIENLLAHAESFE